MSHDTSGLGTRLRQAREERGLSRTVLAERAGVTPGCIKLIEAGARAGRPGTLSVLAGELGVPLSWLLDRRERFASSSGGRDRGVLAIRDALEAAGDLPGMDLGGDEEPPGAAALDLAVRDGWRLYWLGQFGRLAGMLPALVTGSRAAHAARGPSAAGSAAQACQLAADLLVHAGHDDLAYIAARMALRHAAGGDDPLRHAVMAGTMSWVLAHQGRYGDAERVAAAAADGVAPGFGVTGDLDGDRMRHLTVHGSLLLTAAAPAAARGDEAAAREYLRAAAVDALPFTGGDRHDDNTNFGRTQVAMQEAHAMTVLGRPREALAAAGRAAAGRADLRPISWSALHMDIAAASLAAGRVRQAVDALWEMHVTSAEHARHQAAYRELVREADRRVRDSRVRVLLDSTRLPGLP